MRLRRQLDLHELEKVLLDHLSLYELVLNQLYLKLVKRLQLESLTMLL
jgi:hypothetical protein